MSVSNIVIKVSGPTVAEQVVGIIPNSWKYNEGAPEKAVRAVVIGDNVEQDYAENYENAFSEGGFSLATTVDNLNLTRDWELAKNTLLITATGTEQVRGIEKTWTRTFKNASVDKVEKPMGADTVLEVAFMSDAAV
jgi:hypothetical protein